MAKRDYKALRARALGYAYAMGMYRREQCEDFAQFYCLAVFQDETSRLEYQFANFFRSEGGRNKNGEHIPKYFGNLTWKEWNDEYAQSDLMAPPVDATQKVLISELRSALSNLRPTQMLIASLYHRGFLQYEIAQKLGITQSGVSHHFKEIVKTLRKSMLD